MSSIPIDRIATEIQTAFETQFGTTDPVRVPPESVIRGLWADDTLTDDQTAVVLLLAGAATSLPLLDGTDATWEDVLDTLATHRRRLTTEEFPAAPELCRVGRVVIDFIRETVTEEIEASGWATLDTEYSVSREEVRLLRAAVVKTGLYLFELSVVVEELEDRGSELLAAGLQHEKDATFLETLDVSAFDAVRALNSPTVDQLEELAETWSKLEIIFENNQSPVLAAFCRDIRQTLVAPITGGAPPAQVRLELKEAIDIDGLDVLDYEPVATLVIVAEAVRGLPVEDQVIEDR